MILASIGMLAGLGGLICGGYALNRAQAATSDSRTLAARAAAVGAAGTDPRAVRDVAVLHYDALEEMSGARSFSLALLNSDGDGVVVTSINGRTESRTYAKAITRGDADTLLSPEEYRVIRSARLGNGVGSGVPVKVPPPTPSGDDARGDAEADDQPVTVLPGDEDADESDGSMGADGVKGAEEAKGTEDTEGGKVAEDVKGAEDVKDAEGAKSAKGAGDVKVAEDAKDVKGAGEPEAAKAAEDSSDSEDAGRADGAKGPDGAADASAGDPKDGAAAADAAAEADSGEDGHADDGDRSDEDGDDDTGDGERSGRGPRLRSSKA
jgi:hypothetical protein